jgi:hypothetical protein
MNAHFHTIYFRDFFVYFSAHKHAHISFKIIFHVYIYIYIYTYVCMLNLSWSDLCVWIHRYQSFYIYIWLIMNIHLHIRRYISFGIIFAGGIPYGSTQGEITYGCVYVYIYIYIYICIYKYTYIYIYIYICIVLSSRFNHDQKTLLFFKCWIYYYYVGPFFD